MEKSLGKCLVYLRIQIPLKLWRFLMFKQHLGIWLWLWWDGTMDEASFGVWWCRHRLVCDSGERGGGSPVMEGEKASCPQPVTFPARPGPQSASWLPSNVLAQHGHRAKANHAPQPIMLQTYAAIDSPPANVWCYAVLWAQPMLSQCVLTMSGVKALDFALNLARHNFFPPSFLLQSCSAACLVLALNRRWGKVLLKSSQERRSVCMEYDPA